MFSYSKTLVIILLICMLLNNTLCTQMKKSFENSHYKKQQQRNIIKIQSSSQQRISDNNNDSNLLSQDSMFLSVLNKLMQKYNIFNNHQFQQCFSSSQISQLDRHIQELLQIGYKLPQEQLQSYPSIIYKYILQNFSSLSINCFKNSNDLRWLFYKYNIISPSQIFQTFASYSISNYRFLHSTLVNLLKLWQQNQLQQFLTLFDNTMITIYKKTILQDQWGISVQNPHHGNYTYYGISVSNGLLGVVSQKYPFKVSKTVLAGAYDKYGRGRVDNIVETMNVIDMEVKINGKSFDIHNNNTNYLQYINFKKAQFTGSYSVNNQASVNYKYSTLKNNPSIFYTQVQITAHSDIQISVKNYHRVPEYLNDIQKTFQNIPSKQIYHVMTTKATTKKNKIDIVLSSTLILSEQSKQYLSLTSDNYQHQDWDSEMHLVQLKNIKIKKGQILKYYLFSSLLSSQHHSDPENEAIRLLIKSVSTNFNDLINKHYNLWDQLWKNDIIIQGNPSDQLLIRSMIYHFYSFINENKNYGLSPMGLSGLGYNGHIFWDMDLWMYPAILVLNPNLAKSLIQYRYQRISEAKNNAFLNGYKGVMFPWESSKLGDEQTPVWAAPGPLEHHVTGTVAVAAWNYYSVTQDKQWLKNKGFYIIDAAAQFWESRVQKDNQGKYHIKNVVAADQWAENVDDDAFTNAVAIQTLKIANKARLLLNLPTKTQWDQIRLNIIIHHFPDTNITKQHATYDGQNIKQADVNLLSFPLKQIINKQSILKDLQYYQTRVPTQGTPAMTHAIFALLYSRLGDSKKSYNLFKYSYKNNLLQPFNVLAETQGGTNPYFLTGAGGILQTVIFGYAGLDITDQGIKNVQTVIPDQWKRVVVRNKMNK